MSTSPDLHSPEFSPEPCHRTDPLWRGQLGSPASREPRSTTVPHERRAATDAALLATAASRQRAQLPPFAPLLDEVELAGWTSHRGTLGSHFHDWILLDDGRALVMVGHAAGRELGDAVEAALVAQAAWTAIRAHARHAADAGTILSLAARTLWPTPAAGPLASVAVALVDPSGGRVSLAIAGDCLAWRIRAASCQPLSGRQPPLGAENSFSYLAGELGVSLRERLLLVAATPPREPSDTMAAIAGGFTHLSAETHRRMTAPDAVGIARKRLESADRRNSFAPVSLAVVRRR